MVTILFAVYVVAPVVIGTVVVVAVTGLKILSYFHSSTNRL